ncbi:MAG: amino acid adenylation domain-containing protein [Candidatus Aminicenantes bacterium]|jgi:amino acid adenylation domain-containing protein
MDGVNKIDKKNIESITALTPLQEGILFHYLENPTSRQYFEQLCLDMSGTLDIHCFKEGWNVVVAANELLRTVFRWERIKDPLQIVLRHHQVQFTSYDFSNHAEKSTNEIANEIKILDRNHPFNLEQVPFRVTLCRLKEARYLMLISHHHILYDGWSTGIILREFFQAYEQSRKAKAAALPGINISIPPTVKTPFKEFVKWIQNRDPEKEKNFWKRCLQGFETLSELPIKKHVQGSNRGKECGNVLLRFPGGYKKKLQYFTTKQEITLASLFYSVWGILLQKYTNHQDILFGTTVSGRPAKIKGIENTIGLFINTLPLRININSNQNLAAFLKDVNDIVREREEYENSSLVNIKECSRLDKRKAFFDSIVVIENYPLEIGLMQDKGEFSINSYSIFEMTHYDLTVCVRLFENIEVSFIYNNTVFAQSSIKRLSLHFRGILQLIVNHPGQKVENLDILTRQEKKRILDEFNNTAASFPGNMTLDGWFEEQVIKSPENIAVTFKNQYLTYKELNERADCLAAVLRAKGAEPDTIVGIMAQRSVALMIGLLAILKARGAYLPIDPGYPADRIAGIVKDSGLELMLTTKALLSKAANYCEAMTLPPPEPQDKKLYKYNEISAKDFASPTHLAYVIFTSGSTGRPKGVAVEHRSAVNRLHWMQRSYPIGPGDVILQKTPIVFDVSVWELFWWSGQGASLCLLTPGAEKDPQAIIKTVKVNKVTTMHFVPSMFDVFLESMEKTVQPGEISSLRQVFTSGEALQVYHIDRFNRWLNKEKSIKLVNLYGPTEATVDVSYFNVPLQHRIEKVPIGKPIDNINLYILNPYQQLQPIGIAGELYIAGLGLARGYLNQPQLTAEKFVFAHSSWPIADREKMKPAVKFPMSDQLSAISYIYKTGDLAQWLEDGNIEFIGRRDHQVKVRGVRIEPGEIEEVLIQHPEISGVLVMGVDTGAGETQLCAYFVSGKELTVRELREYLSKRLPDYMIPSYFLKIDKMPMNPSGKVDRKALPLPGGNPPSETVHGIRPKNDVERKIAATWKDILNLKEIGVKDNFFDLGGDSLKIIRLRSRLMETFNRDISITMLFRYTSVSSQARYLAGEEDGEQEEGKVELPVREGPGEERYHPGERRNHRDIAVIGMAGKFPGAENIDQFWENLKNGIESISFFSREELREASIDPLLIDNPGYVKAKGVLEGIEYFDADFFNYTPLEAEIMDPQLRILHECGWAALEHAGYDSDSYTGFIGFYVGASSNFYWLSGLSSHKINLFGEFGAMLLNEKDFFSTRVSYKLNFKGPAVVLQTACSTSLAAIDTARRALLARQCDMALAGGVSITFPVKAGYLYREEMVFSPDGHCRAFDARGEGLVGGNGIGIVVLKRMEDALAHGDTLHAVIKSSVMNNDGTRKPGYTAPSIEGQAEVIRRSLEMAQIPPETIGYIETHGTGTSLGDPVEIEGLRLAFPSNKKGCCAIGSVKTNVGHLDAASGSAGFIKTVLALKHQMIPPSLHFENPNHRIDFDNSPFYINRQLKKWTKDTCPLRAGVSSFGIGGTNVHIILEEAPEGTGGLSPLHIEHARRNYQLIVLSAQTPSALDKMTENLTEYFKKNLLNRENGEHSTHPGPTLADAAYTLQVGRKALPHRKMTVCSTINEVVETLSSPGSREVRTSKVNEEKIPVVFMFPGLGSQYVNMGLELYRTEPAFREEMDRCFKILNGLLDYDIKEVLYPLSGSNRTNKSYNRDINQTEIAQLAIFIIEYAMAILLMRWGIAADALLGYSFGEYPAACLSGVFSLEDALKLVVYRSQLMHTLPIGAMLSIPLPEEKLNPLLDDGISLAISNGPSCIVAGEKKDIHAFEKKMKAMKYLCMPLQNHHAVHSRMMEPILKEFEEMVAALKLNRPKIPYISNVTGDWITDREATDPAYWARHLRETVRFDSGIKKLVKEKGTIFLEVGPGRDLSTLIARYLRKQWNQKTVTLLRPPQKKISASRYLLKQVGQLWLDGIKIDGNGFYGKEKRQRIPLPLYPFEKKKYPVEVDGSGFESVKAGKSKVHEALLLGRKENKDLGDWGYVPSWERSILSIPAGQPGDSLPTAANWLVFTDGVGLGGELVKQLQQHRQHVVTVKPGPAFTRPGAHRYEMNPGNDDHYDLLFKELEKTGNVPQMILHLWGMDEELPEEKEFDPMNRVEKAQDLGLYSLITLAQSMGRQTITRDMQIIVITTNVLEVTGDEMLCPEKATILAPVKIIPLEYPNISCRIIDVAFPRSAALKEWKLYEDLFRDIISGSTDKIIAYRGSHRWKEVFKPIRLDKPCEPVSRLREGGVYLVTGGLGGIGLTLAEYLAKSLKAKLVLTGRSLFPPGKDWKKWLAANKKEDKVSQTIHRLLKFEEAGAEVMVANADTADQQQMERVLARIIERFGQLNGVIHCAGVADYAGVIQNRTRAMTENILRPKVKGTLVLERVLKDITLDFLVLFSSIGTVLFHRKFGQIGYVAANEFIDAYVSLKRPQSCKFTAAINWADWQQVGMSVQSARQWAEILNIPDYQTIINDALLPAEGIELFCRILNNHLNRVVVSHEDLPGIIEHFNTSAGNAFHEAVEKINFSQSRQPRPELSTAYEAPTTETQLKLAEIWQDLFGIHRLGLVDDFFELGGDSLKAINAASKIQKELNVTIPIAEFFNRPTMGELAAFLDKAKTGPGAAIEKETELQPAEKRDYYPLSSAQQRMFILQHIEPESTGYNMTFAWILEGEWSLEKLEKSFIKLIHRHEILRTSFALLEGVPMQRVHEKVKFEMESGECREIWEDNGIKDKGVKEELKRFKRPFKLENHPLFRTKLLKSGEKAFLLLVDIHHIISDGISNNIFINHLLCLYEGKELLSLQWQYKDYAVWQNLGKIKQALKEQENYWLNQFQGEIPPLNLPFDYLRPRIQSSEGSSLHFYLDKEWGRRLEQLALKEEVTLYIILLAVFNILLSRLSAQEDIVLGTPLAGRKRHEMDNIMGMFVNTLALRNFPVGSKVFTEFLKEVKDRTLQSFENQDYQFNDLVEKLDVERDLSRNPIFDVLFGFQNMEKPEIPLTGLKFRPYEYDSGESLFDLSLDMENREGRMKFTLEYCSQLFKGETIERFAQYLRNIISEITMNPGLRLRQIQLMPEAEMRKIVEEVNGTDEPYPQDKTLHELFEHQVEKSPDHIALVCEGIMVAYRALNRKVNRLAGVLKEQGVMPDCIVGLMTEPSIEMIAGILGILKAGGAYLPMDYEAPPHRIGFILKDSNLCLVLMQREFFEAYKRVFDSISPLGIRFLDEAVGDGSPVNSKNPPAAAGFDDLVYVIYTSGTTGKPKGVPVENRNIVNFSLWLGRTFGLGNYFHYILLSKYTFDPSAGDIFASLLSGAVLFIADRYMILNKKELRHFIGKNRIHMINTVPSLLTELLCGEEKLTSVQVVVSGGEKLEDSVKDQILQTGYVLYNHFGPTEATVDPLSIRCSREKVTIGRPISNMRCYVVDQFTRLTPIGVPGEICLAGDGVARGYLNNPGITAEKFIGNPFEKDGVMYKTGDLCRINPGKNVEFIGRIDQQVKIRGIRIELGEIETLLARHPQVKEVVVTAEENRTGARHYLCAYLTSRHPIDDTDLRNYLSSFLPGYMIPSYFVQLERLPLTSHGKIDVKALPKPGLKRPQEIALPGDRVECFLTGVWQRILNTGDISIYDNFFHIGGNSLLIMKMKAMIEAEYPKVTVMDLFAYPTISKLARFIRDMESDSAVITLDAAIPLPEDYFSDFVPSPGDNGSGDSFKFNINKNIREKVEKIAHDMDIEEVDIFLSLMVYAFYQLSDKEKIVLQTMMGPVVDRIESLAVDMKTLEDSRQLYRQVNKNRLKATEKREYKVEDLHNLSFMRMERAVVPLVYRKDVLTSAYEFFKYFDIVIEMDTDMENEIEFLFEYNPQRLNQGGMERFVKLYADLLVSL